MVALLRVLSRNIREGVKVSQLSLSVLFEGKLVPLGAKKLFGPQPTKQNSGTF